MSNAPRNGSVTPLVTPPEVKKLEEQPLLQHATSTGDVLACCLQDLGDRGIVNPEQFAHLDSDAIAGTVRWFDAQAGRVGTGVLVAELRAGGKPGWQPSGSAVSLESQREYGLQIRGWLTRNFPELCDASGMPHHQAIVAVLHLHHREGKGRLTRERHGDDIRGYVDAWDERHREVA